MAAFGRKNDDALALQLAAGDTLAAAAAAAKCSERTAARRWADPDFRRRVRNLRGDMMHRALGRLADGMTKAADVLQELLTAATPPAVRLGACRAMLEMGCRLREIIDLAERMDEYDRQLAAINHRLQGAYDRETGNGHE
jgi:hypothetical protein